MSRKALGLVLTLALSAWPLAAAAQAPSDPDLQKGVRLVEEGDYDTAILTLDAAARRLAADPAKVKELSQAYLYLGIAYVGKGHEAAAKAKFREAVARIRDLSLSPDKFPPKVIDLFEAAKEEQNRAPAAPPKAAQAPPEQKKGGGGKVLLIVGGVAVAGGAVALAGGGGSSSSSTPSGSSPTAPPGSITEGPFTGALTIDDYCRTFTFTAGKSGTFQAKVTWQEANAELGLDLFKDPDWDNVVAQSNRITQNEASLSGQVVAGKYNLNLCHKGNSCQTGVPTGVTCAATYSLTVNHP